MDERDDLIREREQERARIERADDAGGVSRRRSGATGMDIGS